ncbi:leucine-rich repeat-containing protein 71-like [Styela clava]
MGKKTEKSIKGGGPASANSRAEDSSTPEPYNCTGNFPDDFAELWQRTCQEKDMAPVIRARPRPPSPPGEDAKTSPQEEEEADNEEEPPPSTYTAVERNVFFKPSIQCEFEVEETKQLQINHPQQMYVRGWKIEEKLITVLKLCLLDKLTTLNLWHSGLTDHTFKILTNFLPALSNVKTIAIEGNAIPDSEPFSELITKDIPIQHLSLRNNEITDKGAEKIGKALGSLNLPSPELLTLNLSFNHISDEGAKGIAVGLRMNRVLTSLSLASNRISDSGAQAISASLQWFTLTHEEVVHRRKMMSERGIFGRGGSAPGSRRGDSKDRPGSNRSGSQVDKTRGSRGSSKKKDAGKGGDKTAKKDEGKGKKDPSKLPSKMSIVETPKSKGRKSGGKDSKRGNMLDVDSPDMLEHVHPLLDLRISHKHGKVYAPGCFTLVCLNLSRNQIGEHGMKSLLDVIKHQTKQKERGNLSSSAPGLLKLSLQKNRVPHDTVTYLEIFQYMLERDPIKSETKSPEEELQSVAG